jgi:hypothetical protein
VAVGEATFSGKEIMKSDNGMIDYYELNRLTLFHQTGRKGNPAKDHGNLQGYL